MPTAKKDTLTLSDLRPDERNANRGTERGAFLLDKSLRTHGAGRSILVDKDNNIIVGSNLRLDRP